MLFDWFPRRPSAPDGGVGVVLSGGGVRSSFQLGALTLLYRRLGLKADAFVGTSAGAIVASALAQHAEASGQAAAVDQLTRLWFDLREPADMFVERQWFSRLSERVPELVTTLTAMPDGHAQAPRRPALFARRHAEPSAEQEKLDPISAALAEHEPQPEWSPVQLVQMLAQVGRLGRVGTDLPAIWRGAERSKSCYRPGPLLGRLLEPELFDPDRVAASGVRLRMAMVSLETGELHFMREDGTMASRDDVTLDERNHSLSVGVLASCAIPAVFQPVEIGDHTYVDGGVRETVPAEMAVAHLRTDPTYVISSAPPGVRRIGGRQGCDIPSVAVRSTQILIDEALRDEVAFARRAGAIVIEPRVAVHDSMQLDPGLIRINWDHGWISAAEAISPVAATESDRHAEIIEQRVRAHALEERFLADQQGSRGLAELVRAKYRLKELVAGAAAGALPEAAPTWWETFEEHVEAPSVAAPWLD